MKITDDMGFILVFLIIIALCIGSFFIWLFGLGKMIEDKMRGEYD